MVSSKIRALRTPLECLVNQWSGIYQHISLKIKDKLVQFAIPKMKKEAWMFSSSLWILENVYYTWEYCRKAIHWVTWKNCPLGLGLEQKRAGSSYK